MEPTAGVVVDAMMTCNLETSSNKLEEQVNEKNQQQDMQCISNIAIGSSTGSM